MNLIPDKQFRGIGKNIDFSFQVQQYGRGFVRHAKKNSFDRSTSIPRDRTGVRFAPLNAHIELGGAEHKRYSMDRKVDRSLYMMLQETL